MQGFAKMLQGEVDPVPSKAQWYAKEPLTNTLVLSILQRQNAMKNRQELENVVPEASKIRMGRLQIVHELESGAVRSFATMQTVENFITVRHLHRCLLPLR